MSTGIHSILKLWKEEQQEDVTKDSSYPLTKPLKSTAALFSPGLFYFYVLHFPTLKLEYISEGTKEILGIPPQNLSMQELLGFVPPEEFEGLRKNELVVVDFFFRFLKKEEIQDYKVLYFFRFRDQSGKIHNMMHQMAILSLTDDGKAEYVLGIHTDISHLPAGDSKTISFININAGKSYFNLNSEAGVFNPDNSSHESIQFSEILTKRELQILRLLANGLNNKQIAEQLYISVSTIRTHRKNILKKVGCSSTTEAVAKFIVQGS